MPTSPPTSQIVVEGLMVHEPEYSATRLKGELAKLTVGVQDDNCGAARAPEDAGPRASTGFK